MTDSRDTAELLQQLRRGDRSAFEPLMARHRSLLREYIELRLEPALRRRVDPSDIVQEAQIEIIRRMDDYLRREPMPFQIWVRKTAYQNLLRLRRRHLEAERRDQRREVSLPESVSLLVARQVVGDGSRPLDEILKREMALRVQQALAELGEIDREVLLLRAYEGLDNQSVAQLLELDPGASSKRYARALLRLRRVLLSDGVDDFTE